MATPPKQQQPMNVKDEGSVTSSLVPPRPKRPLSAFNLFYRFKRQKALTAISLGKNNIEYIRHLIKCPPGLEDYPPNTTNDAAPQVMKDLRRYNITKDLNLLPREDTKKRSHRTNQSAMNGAMSFVEMGKIMNATWKSCDDFARGVFDELSEKGKVTYNLRLGAWMKASEGGGAGPAAMKRKYTKAKKPADSLKLKKPKAGAESPTKKRKPDGQINCPTGKASPGTAPVEIKSSTDHELFMGAAEAKQIHPPENTVHSPKACTSPLDEFRQSPPNLTFKQQDPISNGYDQFLTNVAKSNIPTAASKKHNTFQQAGQSHSQFQGQSHHDETDLRIRIMELEGQLASERLLARIGHLERDLANHRANQGQLRTMIDMRGDNRAAAVTYPPSNIQGGGYCEELSRTQIMPRTWNGRVPPIPNPHPAELSGLESLVQATEIDTTLSRMAATIDASTIRHEMPHPSAQALDDLGQMNTTNTNLYPSPGSDSLAGRDF